MFDAFFFIGLPYIAVFVMVFGSLYRYYSNRFSYSSLSSQFLESKRLLWGSMPWHLGILIILIGHLIPIFAPELWQALTANFYFLITVEVVGVIAAFLSLVGLAVLLYRRLTSAKIQAVTTSADLTVLGLLIFQILVGITVATGYRWGAAWSTSTTTPYLWSLVTLQPNTDYILGLPPTVKLHLIVAWIIFLLVPFTRLVHLFSLPIAYLWRPPIKVVWTNPRRLFAADAAIQKKEEARRYFLRGALGLATAGLLLSVGVLDKLVRFFRGPEMTKEEKAELLNKKLERLKMTAKERKLELERMRNPYIQVAPLAQLNQKDGKYFIDYQMRPALAFKDPDGLPLLISAQCTHLGCTVASTLDKDRRLLCPCHVSYFDVETGRPEAGSPAKTPLPHLGWVLMDPNGEIVATQGPDGKREGTPDGNKLDTYSVYIAKQFEETA